MNILFYDGVCPNPYDYESLVKLPLGGTEATVLRIGGGLEGMGYDVTFKQRHRTENVASFESLESIAYATPHIVITLRDAGHYITNKKRWPKAKHYLWLHDHVSGEYQQHLQHHLAYEQDERSDIIAVSEFHKTNIVDALYKIALEGKLKVKTIYNPVVVSEFNSPLINRKLVYFSSPHKGLDYTLKLFGYLINIDPSYKLYIANPGYITGEIESHPNVINLGPISHSMVLAHVQEALCVFYPNITFPETFGLVYGEANALGTPVLAHPIGAAREVLQANKGQLIDCRLYKDVIDTVIKWGNGERPVVSGNPNFHIDSVLNEWVKLL